MSHTFNCTSEAKDLCTGSGTRSSTSAAVARSRSRTAWGQETHRAARPTRDADASVGAVVIRTCSKNKMMN